MRHFCRSFASVCGHFVSQLYVCLFASILSPFVVILHLFGVILRVFLVILSFIVVFLCLFEVFLALAQGPNESEGLCPVGPCSNASLGMVVAQHRSVTSN